MEHRASVGAVGIGLQCDLSIARDLEPAADHGQKFTDAPFSIQAGSAAPKIDGVHQIAPGLRGSLFNVGEQGLLVGVHALLPVRQGIEVAVIALALAEGDMNVEAQLFAHGGPTLSWRFARRAAGHLDRAPGVLPLVRG